MTDDLNGENDDEHHDAETGEILPAALRAPRIRTIDQIIQRANGGEYRDEMPRMLEAFFAHLFHHAQDHGIIAKGSFTVTIGVKVDRYGETEIGIQPKVKLPDPPMADHACRWHAGHASTARNANLSGSQTPRTAIARPRRIKTGLNHARPRA